MAIQKLECVTLVHLSPTGPSYCQRKIPMRDIALAIAEAMEPCSNHERPPNAFFFETLLHSDPIDDGMGGKLDVLPRRLDKSGMFFLDGKLLTIDAAKESDDRIEQQLVAVMEQSKSAMLLVCGDDYIMGAAQFLKEDVVVDKSGNIVMRGDEPKLVALRRKMVLETCDA